MAGRIDPGSASLPEMRKLFVGTSGWNYDSWKDGFYAGVPKKGWLRFAAQRFTGIEVNATFYGLQKRSTFEKWRDETPEDFGFAVKGNRYLTHNKKLLDPEEPIRREREGAEGLGDKLKAVLWQLPERFQADLPRLRGFLEALRELWPISHTVEFRHPSWFKDEVAECLRSHGVVVGISDAADWPIWEEVTADLVYVRLHGHTRTYASSYSTPRLAAWADGARAWLAQGREVHVYFDNDREGAAPRDASRLLEMLRRSGHV